MTFQRRDEVLTVPLHRRSLVTMQGSARYQWRHSITARKSDGNRPRRTRLSVTFREVK